MCWSTRHRTPRRLFATATLQLLGDVTGSVAIAAGSTAQLSATVGRWKPQSHHLECPPGLQTALDDKASLTGTPTHVLRGTVVAPAVNSVKSAPYTLAGGGHETPRLPRTLMSR